MLSLGIKPTNNKETKGSPTHWHHKTRFVYWLEWYIIFLHDIMMTPSNGNIFRLTDPLCGEFTGHRWIPLTNISDAELWCFLWSAPERTVEQTTETSVIWVAIALIMTSIWRHAICNHHDDVNRLAHIKRTLMSWWVQLFLARTKQW